jgi:hypothetical protein
MKMNIVEKLAHEFANQMAETLTTKQLAQVISVNLKTNDHTCHSGDIIDSNMVMESAFIAIGLGSPHADCQIETDLWNAAWDMAKGAHFYRPKLVTVSETMLMVRHLSRKDADLIVGFIEGLQEDNTLEYACIKSEHRVTRLGDTEEVTMTW